MSRRVFASRCVRGKKACFIEAVGLLVSEIFRHILWNFMFLLPKAFRFCWEFKIMFFVCILLLLDILPTNAWQVHLVLSAMLLSGHLQSHQPQTIYMQKLQEKISVPFGACCVNLCQLVFGTSWGTCSPPPKKATCMYVSAVSSRWDASFVHLGRRWHIHEDSAERNWIKSNVVAKLQDKSYTIMQRNSCVIYSLCKGAGGVRKPVPSDHCI